MKTTNRYDFFTGILLGLMAPIIGMYFFAQLYLKSDLKPAIERLIENHTFTQALTIVVVLSNLFVFSVFNKKNQWQKAKGVIGATLLFALFIVYWEIFR
jgi:hypothetical protein